LKRIALRPQAQDDLVEAAGHYRTAGNAALAVRMVDAALASLDVVARQPGIGSPRLGHLCGIPGLRSWRVRGFPMQWFYFERADLIDVVRLLGDRQDIIRILAEPS
jgi:toxin ParE1/3/4